jgi:hypothetical protein
MTTRKSVFEVLLQYDDFRVFREMLESSGLLERLHDDQFATPYDNISAFNTYHYTVYVPTNESIEALINSGKLPTWEQVEAEEKAGETEKSEADAQLILNFLRYHIQDNSLVIGGGTDDDDHETALIDSETHRFHQLHSKLTATGLTVRDNTGSEAHVMTDSGLYNLMAREYQYMGTSAINARMLQTTSSAVIHLIDKPLMYK